MWNGGGRHGVFVFPKGEGVKPVHETQKPVRLMCQIISLFTTASQSVLDPFMGSGTTLVACEKLGRKGVGIEKDPEYFEVACKRVDESARQPDLFIEPASKPKQEAMDL